MLIYAKNMLSVKRKVLQALYLYHYRLYNYITNININYKIDMVYSRYGET